MKRQRISLFALFYILLFIIAAVFGEDYPRSGYVITQECYDSSCDSCRRPKSKFVHFNYCHPNGVGQYTMYRCNDDDWFIGRGLHFSAGYYSDSYCKHQIAEYYQSGYCYNGNVCRLFGCKRNMFFEYSCSFDPPDLRRSEQTQEEEEEKSGITNTIIAVGVLLIVWIGGIIAGGYLVYRRRKKSENQCIENEKPPRKISKKNSINY